MAKLGAHALLIAATIALSPRASWSQPMPYDGFWWSTADRAEREGYISALVDCLRYDTQKPLDFAGTFEEMLQEVDQTYSGGKRKASVLETFRSLGRPEPKRTIEENPFGDVYWRSHNERTRLGFVEGFLACRQPRSSTLWPKSPLVYVRDLNRAYNADDRLGENAPEYEGTIGQAMTKVAKHEAF